MYKILKMGLKRLIGFFVLIILVTLVTNFWVVISTQKQWSYSIRDVPKRRVALVLGTSRKTSEGNPNPFFDNRIKSAAELYKSGKITHIIVSGDNRSRYYNEPGDMKKSLISLGIPANAITMDHAGLRTLDSIIRCFKIYGQKEFVLVTQSFHCPRALFIANYYDLDVFAVAADEPVGEYPQLMIREWIARTLAVTDLYIWNKQPAELGDPKPISND
jgi:SanA protein